MTIDFDLRQLEVFCKVVELQSFSKAADAVFLAQASVSERIANLEKIIGTRLLDRLGRQVVPTKAGKILYKHGKLLLDMKKTAALELEDFLGIKKGKISIGGSTIPGEYILPGILNDFQKLTLKPALPKVNEKEKNGKEKKVKSGQKLTLLSKLAYIAGIVSFSMWLLIAYLWLKKTDSHGIPVKIKK